MAEEQGVAITGLGLVLPQGVGLAAADDVFAGRSAVRYLPDMADLPEATGAACLGFTPLPETEHLDRAVQLAIAAADEAWDHAGLAGPRDARPCASRGGSPDPPRTAASERGLAARWVGRPTARDRVPAPDRVATILSLSKGAVFALVQQAADGGADCGEPLDVTPDAAARTVAARLGLAGPIGAPVTACASGGHALVVGAGLIRRGVVDAALVGAAEASLHPLIIGSYRRMGVLADARGDPATSVRPFSASRRGFAIGEGAGVLVLESLASAARRGARPIAVVQGWAGGCQTAGLTDMEPDGKTLAHLLRLALERAAVPPEDVDYVNAHGTATVSNDAAEARAIRIALGDAAAEVSVSSTKGSHGHLLGAATAVELVLTVLAIRRGAIPPTVNLTDPDPAIGLDCTALTARRRPVRRALKIASGFGGQMLAVVLASPDGERDE